MQDRWVGDIGDFGKYGLLRAICGAPQARVKGIELGIVWCYNGTVPKQNWAPICTSYEYRHLDPPLFDVLERFCGQNSTIAQIEDPNNPILPTNIFYGEPLFQNQRPGHWNLLKRDRADRWLRDGIEATVNANVIFLDPDTGIAPDGEAREDEGKNGPRAARKAEYVYSDEIMRFAGNCESLIIYQHMDQSHPPDQIRSIVRRLQEFGRLNEIHLGNAAVRIFFWQKRFFIVFVHPNHQGLSDALDGFADSGWCTPGNFSEETHWLGELANNQP